MLQHRLMYAILPEFTDVVLNNVARLVIPLVDVSSVTPQHNTVLLSNTRNSLCYIRTHRTFFMDKRTPAHFVPS